MSAVGLSPGGWGNFPVERGDVTSPARIARCAACSVSRAISPTSSPGVGRYYGDSTLTDEHA